MNEPHINDILMRHKTLTETNEDLRVISLANTTNIEREQLRQNDLIKSHNDNMLTSNSQLSTCQKRLDKMRTMTSTLEQRFDQKNQSGMLRMRALGETMLAIENLHARVLGSFVFLAQMKAAAGAVANVAITSQQQQQRVRAGATVRGRSRSSSKATTAELSRGNLDSATASLHSVNQLAEQAKTANDAVSHSLVPSTKDPSATASSTSKQDPHAAPTQPQHSTPRTTIPWPQKLIQIQNRVIDLTEIADKAQEFVVAAEKVKRADADKLMRVADANGSGAKDEKSLEREKRRNVAQQQQPLKSSRNGTSSSNSGNGSAVQSMISELAV